MVLHGKRFRDRATALAGAAALLLCCRTHATSPSASATNFLDDFKIPLWHHSVELRGDLGYRNNVLLNHTNPIGSGFWMSGAELMLFRLPTRGWQFNLFADFADARYFDAPSVGSEQLALAAAQLAKDLGQGWKSTLGLNYLFQNQVFDYSSAYTNETGIGLIRGHAITPRWGVRKTINQYWIEGEFSAIRQWLDEPLDSYWQTGPRAAAGFKPDRNTDLYLSYQWSRLAYDTREQIDSTGAPLPGTSLGLDSHFAELVLTHAWDRKQRWHTDTRLGYEATLDNGSGYFDCDNYRLSQLLRYRQDPWEITARARVSHYEYSSQTTAGPDTALRRKTMLRVTLRIEHKLSKYLKAHAACDWDRSISNLEYDDYKAATVVGGLTLIF